MTARSWIRKLFDRKPHTIRNDRVRFRPRLERLEDRTLLSGGITTTTGLSSAINTAVLTGGATTITLASGATFDFTSPYESNNALPVIHGGFLPVEITIKGSGDTIDRSTATGTPAFRLFTVGTGGSLFLENLTLAGGLAKGTGSATEGGAIYSSGTLKLSGVTVQGNEAQGDNGANRATVGATGGTGWNAYGGGLYVAGGTVSLTNDTFSGNTAEGGTGGTGGKGHAVQNRSGVHSIVFGGSAGSGGAGLGGGMYVAAGTVTLTNDTLNGNTAEGGTGGNGGEGHANITASGRRSIVFGGSGGSGGAGSGGGMFVATGTVILTNDTLSSNNANGGKGSQAGSTLGMGFKVGVSGSGGAGSGGGVYVAAGTVTLTTVTLTNDTLSSNNANGGTGGQGDKAEDGGSGGSGGAAMGGGLDVAGGTFTLTNDTLASNNANGGNGGKGGTADGSGRGVVFAGGTGGQGANGMGGGLYVGGGRVTLLNGTLTSNAANGGSGGTGGTAPFHDEKGGGGGVGATGKGGGLYIIGGSTMLTNTLIAQDTSKAGPGGLGGSAPTTHVSGADGSAGSASDPDISGNVTSSDDDLIGDGTGSNLSSGDPGGDLVGYTAAQLFLGSLANNGGPTQTIALEPNSPAIDKGNSTASGLPSTDQRGYPRISGSAVDIGAYEVQPFSWNTLPDGIVGFAYSGTITATPPAFEDPITYSLASGTLPTGLSLASNGTLSGTPTASGSFTFTVTASDAGFGSQPYTVVINPVDLIAEINAANSSGTPIALPSNAILGFSAAANSTNGGNALPVITGNVTIVGNGATIERTGANVFRLFDVAQGGSLTLENLTLTGGLAQGNGVAAEGGAIYSSGTLKLSGVTVKSNKAQANAGANVTRAFATGGTGANAYGGGLYLAGGTVHLTNDTLLSNRADGGNGGNASKAGNGGTASGGGMYVATGTVTLSNTTLSENVAQGGRGGSATIPLSLSKAGTGGAASGGGMDVAGGTVTLSNDTLASNSAIGGNGGNGSAGTDSVFSAGGSGGSGGAGSGGGVYVTNTNTTVKLINDTFSSNNANGGSGGSGGAGGTPQPSPANGNNLSGGSGGSGGAGSNGIGGGLYIGSGSTTLANTLIAQNTATAGKGGTGGTGGSVPGFTAPNGGTGSTGSTSAPDVSGTVASSDDDLIGDGAGSSGFSTSSGDQVGTSSSTINALLGPLQNNGGPTQTMALTIVNGRPSPAIDKGDNNASGLPNTDQRGFARKSGAKVDIGAFELQQPQISPTTLPSATFGIFYSYSQTITATPTVDASGPFTFAVTSGTLPQGLNLAPDGTLSGVPQSTGTYPFTITATDSNGDEVTTQAYSMIVLTPTAIAVSASSTAPVFGEGVTLTATLTSTAGGLFLSSSDGTVTFYDGATALGPPQALSSANPLTGTPATATLTNVVLAAGPHMITARYSGDSLFAASQSGVTPASVQTVVPATGLKPLLVLPFQPAGPTGVAVDSTGDVFIADPLLNTVFEFKPDGTQTMVGSGLLGPEGVAVDQSGNVFIADTFNNRIVEVTPGGTQTPVALGINQPYGVAVDKNGNIFTSEFNNNQVVEITPPTSPGGTPVVSTFASGLNQPDGVAVDIQGDVFIADSANNQVVEVRAGTTTLTTVVPALNDPRGVAVDSNGDLFIADTGNNRVLEATSKPTFTPLGSGLNGPWGVAVDSMGDVFIPDTGNARVVELNAAVPVTVSPMTTANLQTVLATTSALTLNAADNTDAQAILTAVNGLTAPSSPVTITVNLASGSYTDLIMNPPTNVTLDLVGTGSTTNIVGSSPAVQVTQGQGNVSLSNATLSTATDAPTILVSGGSLTLRNDTIQESTGGTDAAIDVTGGSVDLGTSASSPGGNVLNVNGSGEFVHNTTANSIPAYGDTFEINGAAVAAPYLSFTSLTNSSATTQYGQAVTLTAVVRPNTTPGSGTPGGSVHFFDVSTNTDLGPVALSGGSASLLVSDLAAGTHLIRVSYSGDSDFTQSLDFLTQTVIPAPLTITANDVTIIQGEALPVFTVTYNGFVLGQDFSVLNGTLTFATASNSTTPGTYAITPSGLTSGNYAITFLPGKLTILSYGQATTGLQAQVDAAGLDHGIQNSLDSQLQAAIASFAVGNTNAGVNQLGAFINHVSAQSGKKIAAALADAWIAYAQRIIKAVG